MTWYLILRRNVKSPKEWTVSLDEHLAWMRRQHEAGSILFSGPSAGPSTESSLGIYVVRAGSRPEAEGIASTDPFTAAGFCTFDLIEWHVDQVLGVGPFTAAQAKALARG